VISSFDEYLSRCKPGQQEIYSLCAPSCETALESPYLEAFEKSDKEVIFMYSTIDEFVMSNLGKYQDRVIVSVEKGDLDVLEEDVKDSSKNEKNSETKDIAEPYKLSV
jgi:HSP90 family molecular chaperone